MIVGYPHGLTEYIKRTDIKRKIESVVVENLLPYEKLKKKKI